MTVQNNVIDYLLSAYYQLLVPGVHIEADTWAPLIFNAYLNTIIQGVNHVIYLFMIYARKSGALQTLKLYVSVLLTYIYTAFRQ